MNDFFRSLSVKCEDTLKICKIGAEEFDCCAYSKSIMTDMGNCFQLDMKNHPASTTKQIGVSNGLQIFANYHEDNSTVVPEFLVNNEVGFRYFVHSRMDFPFITSEGIGVQLGHRMYSAVSPNRFILMNMDDGGRCIDDWPLELAVKNLTILGDRIGSYSNTRCVAICLASFFYESCGCTPFLYNYNGTFPTCTVYDNFYMCLNKSLNVSVYSSADEIMRRVHPPCLDSCKMG